MVGECMYTRGRVDPLVGGTYACVELTHPRSWQSITAAALGLICKTAHPAPRQRGEWVKEGRSKKRSESEKKYLKYLKRSKSETFFQYSS